MYYQTNQHICTNTRALTEICSWPALEEAPAISTPRVPWCGQDRLDLLLILKEGVQHRRRKLTALHRTQCNERIRRFHEHRRQRLDTPKSKEIKKLLQPVILNSPHATLRASKLLSKRHPDTIDVRMKCDTGDGTHNSGLTQSHG